MIAVFTQRVLEVLQREFPTHGFRLGEEMGVITDGTAQFGLSNLLSQHEQSSMTEEEFDAAIVKNFSNAIKLLNGVGDAIPETWEEAKSRLRVQLVSANVVDLGNAVTFPFSQDVHVSLVSDCDAGYAYIGPEDLERWGQSALDAIEIGKQNIFESNESLPLNVMSGATPLLVIQTGDGYDAARILSPEIRQAIIDQFTSESGDEEREAYVGIPNRDFLIAWPVSTQQELHEQLSETVAKDAKKQAHPLSNRVFQITSETIAPI